MSSSARTSTAPVNACKLRPLWGHTGTAFDDLGGSYELHGHAEPARVVGRNVFGGNDTTINVGRGGRGPPVLMLHGYLQTRSVGLSASLARTAGRGPERMGSARYRGL